MTDKYTELAREWLAEHIVYRVDGKYPRLGGPEQEGEESIATLLRRVAREQIEEDAGIADSFEKAGHIALWRLKREIAETIRSRAGDLEE